jgi:hypothetical protein
MRSRLTRALPLAAPRCAGVSGLAPAGLAGVAEAAAGVPVGIPEAAAADAPAGLASPLPKEVTQPLSLLAFNKFATDRRREMKASSDPACAPGAEAEKLIGTQWKALPQARTRAASCQLLPRVRFAKPSCGAVGHASCAAAALVSCGSNAHAPRLHVRSRAAQDQRDAYMKCAQDDRARIVATQFGARLR